MSDQSRSEMPGSGTETDPYVPVNCGYDYLGTLNMLISFEDWKPRPAWLDTGVIYFVHQDRLYMLTWCDDSKTKLKVVHVRPWDNYDEDDFHTPDLHDLLQKYLPNND